MNMTVTQSNIDDLGLISAYKQLRPLERMFVDAYLADLENDARAAGRRVVEHLASQDAKRHTEKWYADKLMAQPLVRAAITERIEELARKMEISAFIVLKEVGNIAKSSMADYLSFDAIGDPTLKLHLCTPEQLAAIQSIEIEENMATGKRKTKFKLHPKVQALDMLMKHLGLYADDNAQRSPVTPAGPATITQAATTAQAAEMYARTLRKG